MPTNTPSTKQKPKQGRAARRRARNQSLKSVDVSLRHAATKRSIVKNPKLDFNQTATMTPGDLANDARRQTGMVTMPVVDNQTRTVTMDVILNVTTLDGIAMAYVTKALERGFLASSDPNVPYYAQVYLYTILYNYATSGIINVTQLPYWLLALGQAISPKTVKLGSGKISYKFTPTDSAFLPASQFPIGYLPYGVFWNNNTTGGPAVDMFPSSIPSSGYTPELGIVAFQQMVQFMAQETTSVVANPASRLVPVTLKTRYLSDASTFAVVGKQEGLGKAGVGGFAQLVQLEVPIFHPVFAVFVAQLLAPDSTENRFYTFANSFAGDSLYLAGVMSTQLPESEWGMKRMPRFHAVDFIQFADVLAQWVTQVVQAYNNNANTITASEAAFISEELSPEMRAFKNATRKGTAVMHGTAKAPFLQPPTGTCPLTIQQAQLCFRAVAMQNFQKTQASVQNLYPRLPENGGDNQFVPFVACATTCHIAPLDMELPIPLIENLRALVGRDVQLKNGDVQQYVPVLGQYVLDSLNTADYTVINPVSEQVTNVFATEAFTVRRSVNKAGVTVETPMVEPIISLIDGDSSGNLVFINDPNRLKTLVMLWNEWLATNNIKSFSCPTGTLGTELGISSLTSIAMTRQWIPVITRNTGEDVLIDTRVERMKQVVNSVYNVRAALQDTSQSIIFAAAYETVLSKWILPVILAAAGTTYQDQSDPQRWQCISNEPYAVPLSSGTDGVLMSNINSAYASKMVRSDLSKSNDWDEFFSEQAALGRGGVLSSLGTMLDGLIGL